jgi:hypothetical protein
MSLELSLMETIELLNMHVAYIKNLKSFYVGKNVKYRLPNFPEDISENIAKHLICTLENLICAREKKGGDLRTPDNKRIEVKCFSSCGPTSFGPNEKWDMIYFLDATDYDKGNFKLYRIALSNTSEAFQQMPINKKETFAKQCSDKRRPRLAFKDIQKHLQEHVNVVFDGNLHQLYTDLSLSSMLKTVSVTE